MSCNPMYEIGCSSITNVKMKDLSTNITCQAGSDKVGYDCVTQATSKECKYYNDLLFTNLFTYLIKIASLSFNRCLNTPSVYHTFNASLMPSFTRGYFLEFWMKLDTMREDCAPPIVDFPGLIYKVCGTE